MYVETVRLTKHYRRLAALDECSLAVERGEIFGLLGPNGAGKTTLLRILLGFLRPTSGEARIDTLDCHRESVLVRSRVSYLPGEARLFRGLRGGEVLDFFCRIRPGTDRRRAGALADRLGVDLSRPVAYMSTGTRQKLALAAALAPDAPLVILDEPTSSLDPTMRAEVLHLVREAKGEGRTVLFSSHVLSEVEDVCDRVAILRAGKIVHTQVVAELRKQHRILATLVGPLPPAPPELADGIEVVAGEDRQVTIETAGELAPLLRWLATIPLEEVRIEPIGLARVYDRFHGGRRA